MSTPSRRLLALLALAVLAAGAPSMAPAADAASRWQAAGSAPALGVAATGPGGSGDPPLVFPDGRGLPPGSGSAERGAVLYASRCAACHGRSGEGNTAPELIGGDGPLSSPDADKTIATYWPYATTLYDTIARSMPPATPGRLAPGEVYDLCAFLLSRNGLWESKRELDAAGLAAIRMPNRDGFDSFAPP